MHIGERAGGATAPWHTRLPFFYGWIIVSVAFIASTFSIGLTWAAGLLVVPMEAELHWGLSAFFFAVSLRGWVGIVITPLIGSYLDEPRGPRVLSLAGGALNTVSLFFIPFIDSEWQFILLFGVIGGVAQAAQSGTSVAIVPKWFVRQRGSAMSISSLGGGITAIVLPPLVGVLASAAGWRMAWMVLAISAFLLGTLPSLLLHRQPEDLSMLPDGGPERQHQSRAGEARRADEQSFTLHEALHSSAFWVLMVGISIGSLANNGLPATLAPIFVDRGYTFAVAAASLFWYGLASTLTKILFGWITNRRALRSVLLFLCLYGAIVLPSVLIFPDLVGPVLYGFLIGMYIGAFFPLSQMVWADYFGRAHVGAISALGRPLPLFIGSSGPFVLAYIRDVTGSFDLGIWLNALSAALCFLILFLVRPVRRPTSNTSQSAEATPTTST